MSDPKVPGDLYVGNLPVDADESTVKNIFKNCGVLQKVIVKKASSLSHNYAFIKFHSEEETNAALKLAGTSMDGNQLVVRPGNAQKKFPSNRKSEVAMAGGDCSDTPFIKSGYAGGDDRSSVASFNSDCESTGEEMLLIVHIEDPFKMWAQRIVEGVSVTQMSLELASYCPQGQRLKGMPQMNKTYATIFSEDELWYRCQVKQHLDSEKSEVIFVDYGNSEITYNSKIVELPVNLANQEPYARLYELHGLKATYEPTTIGYESAMAYIKNTTHDAPVRAKIFPQRGKAIPIEMWVDDKNINQDMIKYLHAEPKRERRAVVKKTPLVGPRQGNNVSPHMAVNAGYQQQNHSNSSQALEKLAGPRNITPSFDGVYEAEMPRISPVRGVPPQQVASLEARLQESERQKRQLQMEVLETRQAYQQRQEQNQKLALQVEQQRYQLETLEKKVHETKKKKVPTATLR